MPDPNDQHQVGGLDGYPGVQRNPQAYTRTMAVGRLSGAWILAILRSNYPEGVLRRVLLDQFAHQLVSPRSTQGAKGRLARRLYSKLEMLQRKGLISQEEGVVCTVVAANRPSKEQAIPLLGTMLRKKHFLVLMAEDRPAGKDAAQLRQLRWEFLASAISEGWSITMAAEIIGLSRTKAMEIVARPKG